MEFLDWFRHPTGRWSRLAFIAPALAKNVEGVFVIWQDRTYRKVYVGHGNVKDEIVRLRQDVRGTRFGSESLLIAWALIQHPKTRERVHRYLVERLRPNYRIFDSRGAILIQTGEY